MKKRNLKADLEFCDKTTSEVWDNFSDASCEYGVYVAGYDSEYSIHPQELVATCEKVENANFIAQAREGWPHAIERALKAEALVQELVEALEHIERLTELVWQGVGPVTAEIQLAVEGALEKTKEVLGDE